MSAFMEEWRAWHTQQWRLAFPLLIMALRGMGGPQSVEADAFCACAVRVSPLAPVPRSEESSLVGASPQSLPSLKVPDLELTSVSIGVCGDAMGSA